MGTRDREPRASALGWYETGPWPESEGAFAYAQIGKRGGRYIVSGRKLLFSEAVRDVEGGSEVVSGWF
jgi:hypothetical protein